jgi:hypothetical protein
MKIIVGDDCLDFARESMPYIPGAEIEFVDTPAELIRRASSDDFDIVITDLSYSPAGAEGFQVLEALKGTTARRILWTGAAQEPEVRRRALELGAEVLDKPELGSLVGLAVSETPLKTDGLVLVFVPDLKTPPNRALAQVVRALFNPDQVVVSPELKEELMTGKYGLVVDTSALCLPGEKEVRMHGVVAHDLKYLRLPAVPRVVCVHDVTKVVVEIATAIGRFLDGQGKLAEAERI